jgi:AraC-like DNA-binding protein
METVRPSGLQRWSTREVPESQRLDYYASTLTSAIDPMRVSRRVDGAFEAEITSTALGPISLIHGVGCAHDCMRDQKDIARSGERNFHLVLNVGSAWRLNHRRRTYLPRSDAVLLDSRYGYELEFLSPFDVVHVKMSEAWLKKWIPDPSTLAGRAIPSQAGWASALVAFVGRLSPEFVVASPLPHGVIADQVGALLALHADELARDRSRSSAGDRALRDRIHECIVQRCTEYALSAIDVAVTLNVSTRTLHRCLAACQLTFGGLLMAARVDLATRMLESPLFRRLTTAEIGRRAGFSDASHFARVYRRHCGVTPAQVQSGH